MQPEAEGFTVDHYRWVTAATLSFYPTDQMVSAATLWTNHHLVLLIYRILSFLLGAAKIAQPTHELLKIIKRTVLKRIPIWDYTLSSKSNWLLFPQRTQL